MQFEHVHLHRGEQGVFAVDHHRRLAGLFLGVAFHPRQVEVGDMLLKEQLATQAVRRTHQRHRAILEVRQDQRRDMRVVLGHIQFAGVAAGIDDALRVSQVQVAAAVLAGVALAGHGALQIDVAGRFVIAQAVEHRMADHALAGHPGKTHFGQQLRFEPVHSARLGAAGRVGQRRAGAAQWLQALVQAVQGGAAEATADLAGIAQLAGVMQAQQQGAETVAAAFRVGVAEHHELLALLALELDPVVAAALDIGAVPALADQSFEIEPAGTVQQ